MPSQHRLRGCPQNRVCVMVASKTYYNSSSDFSTGITQVTSAGNRFAETIETAILEVEEKVRRCKFIPTQVLLLGKPMCGEGIRSLSFRRHGWFWMSYFTPPLCLARSSIPQGLSQMLPPWNWRLFGSFLLAVVSPAFETP